MSVEILAFIFGCLLILVGVLGGGFEIKELKIPKVGNGVRLVAVVCGLVFIVLGSSENEPPQGTEETQQSKQVQQNQQNQQEQAPPQERQQEQEQEQEQEQRPTASVGVQWLDNALMYDGRIDIYGDRGILVANIYDRATKRFIRSLRQEAEVVERAGGELTISGVVAVQGDSVTPQAHTHDFNLVFIKNGDSYEVANCTGSNCYEAQISE